jgi:hypothetical protein
MSLHAWSAKLRHQPTNPMAWAYLCEYLRLSPALARSVWWALARSETPTVRILHAALSLQQSEVASNGSRMPDDAVSPKRLVLALEALTDEGVLGVGYARQMESHILTMTSATGAWR